MIRSFVEQYYTPIFILFLVLLVSLSYILGVEEGRRHAKDGVTLSCPLLLETDLSSPKSPLSERSEQKTLPEVQGVSVDRVEAQGKYVGSKNGTKYYTPGCPGTNRIKPENYIWFQTAEDATLQGYSKGSC